ncbi:hypothetical protein MD484_g7857, partial [Candolleomyces efflorescens]
MATPGSKLCQGIFVHEGLHEAPYDEHMFVDQVREQVSSSLQQSLTARSPCRVTNPAEWQVVFCPEVQNPTTTRLSEIQGDRLVIFFFKASTPNAPTHLGQALTANKILEGNLQRLLPQLTQARDGRKKAQEMVSELQKEKTELRGNESSLAVNLRELMEEMGKLKASQLRQESAMEEMKVWHKSAMKSDMEEMRSAMEEMKSDMEEMKSDMEEMKSDMAEMKSDMEEMSASYSEHEAKMEKIAGELNDLCDILAAEAKQHREETERKIQEMDDSVKDVREVSDQFRLL